MEGDVMRTLASQIYLAAQNDPTIAAEWRANDPEGFTFCRDAHDRDLESRNQLVLLHQLHGGSGAYEVQ